MGRIDNLGHCTKAVIEVKMHPPLLCHAYFGLPKPVDASFTGFFAFRRPLLPGLRVKKMELKVQYEDKYQTITLNSQEFEDTWLSVDVAIDEDEKLKPEVKEEISLKGKESLSIAEREELLQKAWKVVFNKREYNDYRRETRRHWELRDDDTDNWVYDGDPADILEREKEESEAFDLYQQIRRHLKPKTAEAFIAVHLKGESIRNYATSIGENENNLSKKLSRAMEKLKKVLSKRQI